MARLNSWLSADVMHALGWALIHSLWQGLGVAALAMLAMAFWRRPPVRYVIAVGALAIMLAAPVATFLVLIKPPVSTLPILSGPVAMANRSAVILPQTPVHPIVASADRAIAAVAEAPSRMPNLLPWLVGAWLCGVAVFSLRFAGGFLLLEHRRGTQSGPPGARVLAICQELQRQLGLERAIQYLECSWVQAPAVIGWLRPAVLLPVFALTGLSEEQFRAVIAHELAHIRRHDWFVNLFQILVETLLFYHPAMWWLNRRIRAERELCCDEIAVALTGSRLEYARALAQMAEWKNVSLLAMAANRGPLSERIFHVLGRRPSNAGPRMLGLTGSVLFLAAGLGAANALFGIAYPIPAAKAEIKAVLVSSRSAVEHMARQVFPVSAPAAKVAAPALPVAEKLATAADSQPGNLEVPSADLTRLLPNQSLATPIVVASNPAPAATSKDQTIAADVSATNPTPANAGSEGPATIINCHYRHVWGRVISPQAIAMTGFGCSGTGVTYGSCPDFETNPDANVGSLTRRQSWARPECKLDVTMSVDLADPADASKMQSGKIVNLAGDVHVRREKNRPDYLYLTNAKVVYVEPFDRQAAAADPAKVTQCGNTSVFGRVISANAVEMQGFYCLLSGSVGGNNAAVRFGSCPLASTYSYPGDLSGPYARDPSRTYRGDMVGRLNRLKEQDADCKFDTQMNVRLADPADVTKMQPGEMVRLAGDFKVTRQNNIDYLSVTDARVTWTDPFDRHAAAEQAASQVVASNAPYKITTCNVPNGAGTCDLVTLASATAPGPGRGPRNRTELAMKCWLGLVEYNGCWNSVCGDDGAGPLERVDYLGRTAAGADIYQVRYRYRATEAYRIVPDPKGTVDQYLVKATDPYWIKREISAPAALILIYARPEDAPAAGCSVSGFGGSQLNPPN